MVKRDDKIVFFAKERFGLESAILYLRTHFRNIQVFKGSVGGEFPKDAYRASCDICISYMSPWLIPARILDEVGKFSINFHPGPPNYRGIGCTNFALYNNERDYGVTAHIMTDKADAGRIIDVRRFPILLTDTVYSLTMRCYAHILTQFFYVFDCYLTNGTLPETDESWSRRLYTRRQLNDLCRIEETMPEAEAARRIRATTFPNMPGPYLYKEGKRYEIKAL